MPILRLLLVAAIAAAALPAFTTAASHNPWLERRVLNQAHRGGAFEWPENTLYAYREGLLRGVDVLETDVAITSDGHVVVIHDSTVDRTTNGSGRVAELTLAEVQALDAAYWAVKGGYPATGRPEADYLWRGMATRDRDPVPGYVPEWFRIPTLREVLETFPGVPLNIEIKPEAPQTMSANAQAIADLLAEFERTDDVIVVSFEDQAVLEFKTHAPDVHTAPGLVGAGAFVASTQAAAPGVPLVIHHALQVPPSYSGIEVVTADFVADAHANDLAVHAWTIDSRAEMERLIDLGVDGIMTNRPSLLEQVLAERHIGWDAAIPVPPCPAPIDGECPQDP
ncbi:MAG: glycerophosphodiester phosphodiesterase [Actinobacteria bacterium]|nr:glycerophosphodiester phosphodiesterase [Actinomycetota bacterium]